MSTDQFAHDDAAYVLGALSPEDRAAFEAHLADCDECSRRVAELAPVMDALAGVKGMDGLEADLLGGGVEPVPETLLPSLLRNVRAEKQRQRRLVTALVGLAAAAVLALTGVLAWPSGHSGSAGHAVAMAATEASPVHATATLSSVSWGTKIELACRYDSAYGSGLSYALVVVDKHGVRQGAGTWTLSPGGVTHFTSGTALSRSEISKIEITADNEPILQLNL